MNENAENPRKIQKGLIIGLIVALCIAVAAAITLGVLWAVNSSKDAKTNAEYRARLEDVNKQSYYKLTSNVSDMANGMNKLTAASTPAMQKTLLNQITNYAASAETALSALIPSDVNAEKTVKYVNQVGDYCAYLQKKLDKGGTLTEEDKTNLDGLCSVMLKIEQALSDLREQVENGNFAFMDDIGAESVTGMLDDLENTTVTYPSLIYDGPFSDSLENKEPKALAGTVYDGESGKAKAAEYAGEDAEKVEFLGESKNFFDILMYSVRTDDGLLYVDIAKVGGMPIAINLSREVTEPLYEEKDCEKAAAEYLAAIGFDKMTPVWVSNYNSVMYINFVYTSEDVIYYPDLVVVKVASDNKKIIGLEALNYVYNHSERTPSAPTVTEEEAISTVTAFAPSSVRLAVIPIDGGKEALTYELYGEIGEDKYFVYVNAKSGEEINILRVIDSDKGMLLD